MSLPASPPTPWHWLNAERLRAYSTMTVIICGLAFAAWIVASLPSLVDPRGKPIGYDFMAFWSAARLALDGRPEAAFDGAILSAVQHAAVPAAAAIWFPWHYPPTFLLAVLPLGLLSYPAALAAFTIVSSVLWAAVARRVVPDRRFWIVAAAVPAGLINLLDGQNGFLTAALAGFALLSLNTMPVAAGVLIGLLAIKPHLAVLFPLALIAGGYWRAFAAAVAAMAGLCGASLAVFGWGAWSAFLHHLPLTQAMAVSGAVPWGTMPSAFVFALSVGLPVAAAWGLQVAVAAVSAAGVWRAWRRPDAAFEARAATLLAASLLVSPYLFYYDLVWAALAVGWLAMLGLRVGYRRSDCAIYLTTWVTPVVMVPLQSAIGMQAGFLSTLLLLLIAVGRAAPLSAAERRAAGGAVAALREARWATRERMMRWGIGLALVSAGLVVTHIVTHTAAGLTDADGDQLARDFINYFAGARLAASGLARHAYDVPWFRAFEATVTGAGSQLKLYGYPPIAMLLSLPLAGFSFVPALILWVAAGAGCCLLLLRRLVGGSAAAVAVIAAPAALLNLLSGQNGYFTAALLAGGLILIERRPVLAGLCIGCLGYKPQLAVLVPIALAAGGHWRAFAAAGVTVAALGCASLALFGTATWVGFIDQMVLQRHLLEIGTTFWHRMPTAFAAARLAGMPVAAGYVVQFAAAAVAAAAVACVWRRPGSAEIKAAVLVVASFLATPYAWDYDAVALIFAAAWLARAGIASGFRRWERAAVIALLALPVPAMALAATVGLQPGPIVLAAVLLVLVRRALDDPAPPIPAPAPRREPAGLRPAAAGMGLGEHP